MLKAFLHFIVFVTLTILTQIGGIIYLLVVIIVHFLKLNRLRGMGIFIGLYFLFSTIIVPSLAPYFGRVPLPFYGSLRQLNPMTFFLNRHYVTPTLKSQIVKISKQMNQKYKGTKTQYLDASFPFFDGFPLLPHLSHNDGKKLDLAFYYIDQESNKFSNNASSFIGYGVYEAPLEGEESYPQKCAESGYWQYGLLTYFVPKWNADQFKLDEKRTNSLLQLLANSPETSKIFLEPHLKTRWHLDHYDKIHFHGCQAVRHDDHIHIQIK